MRRSLGVGLGRALLGAVVLVALSAGGCEDPTGGVTGVTAVSSVTNGHFHRATIPLSDINDPPAAGRDYVSTAAEGHSHVVHLSELQLADLQQNNALVEVASGASGTPAHTHQFTFER